MGLFRRSKPAEAPAAASGPPAEASSTPSEPDKPQRGIRGWLARNERLMWWMHSVYALALGVGVMLFAAKGFAHARWLGVSLGIVFLVMLLLFRFFGAGAERQIDDQGARVKVSYYVMTAMLKNGYQTTLFFVLPFYWRATTFDSPNLWLVCVLGTFAFLSTLDVVFDHFLMKWKAPASVFYFVVLFATTNLVIPALLPGVPSLWTLLIAAGLAALAFALMHIPPSLLRRPLVMIGVSLWTGGIVVGTYYARAAIPPVAMSVTHAGVGPTLLDDGRLAVEASSVHASLVTQLHAETDVAVPGGKGDRLWHVWRHEGKIVQTSKDVDPSLYDVKGTVRLRSTLAAGALPEDPTGQWTVDVVTVDGQLVGRARFEVTE